MRARCRVCGCTLVVAYLYESDALRPAAIILPAHTRTEGSCPGVHVTNHRLEETA